MDLTFHDDSTRSFGAVVYIKTLNAVRCVIARPRVAPIRSVTLPQLELTAANMAACLVS